MQVILILQGCKVDNPLLHISQQYTYMCKGKSFGLSIENFGSHVILLVFGFTVSHLGFVYFLYFQFLFLYGFHIQPISFIRVYFICKL
jgi:hypothetical protein